MKEPVDSSNNDESSQRGELQVEVPNLNTGDKNIFRECCFVPCFWLFFNFPQLDMPGPVRNEISFVFET